jgi:hypothetical protein
MKVQNKGKQITGPANEQSRVVNFSRTSSKLKVFLTSSLFSLSIPFLSFFGSTMKPLARCTTPSPSPTTPRNNSANGDLATENSSECNGYRGEKDNSAASPSSSSSASLSSRRVVRSRVRRRIRPRVLLATRGSAHDDLALPLGMSFAAVLSQV